MNRAIHASYISWLKGEHCLHVHLALFLPFSASSSHSSPFVQVCPSSLSSCCACVSSYPYLCFCVYAAAFPTHFHFLIQQFVDCPSDSSASRTTKHNSLGNLLGFSLFYNKQNRFQRSRQHSDKVTCAVYSSTSLHKAFHNLNLLFWIF